MRILKKIGLLLVLLFVAAVNVFVYMNHHLYYRAMGKEAGKPRIDDLERSNRFAPLNDLVFYELGKAYFDMGMERLGETGRAEAERVSDEARIAQSPETGEKPDIARNEDKARAGEKGKMARAEATASASDTPHRCFEKSVENLKRSISINPASPFAHYYLGQSLLHLNFFEPGKEEAFLSEFRKAAELAGEDSELFEEVGKIFFSRWLKLDDKEREFTLDLIRKVLARRDEAKAELFFHIWEMNVSDCSVMEMVLPRAPEAYRQFAAFLGEKSLSLEERHRFMAEAERLDFERARREVELGEAALFHLRTREARGSLERALGRLRNIRFYQTLRAQNLISNGEWNELKKRALLSLIRSSVEERGGLKDIEGWLREYLAIEDQPKEVGSLEEYLRVRGVLPERFRGSFDDLGRLAVELLFQFKQNRYRDIINIGRALGESFVIIPEAKKKDYVAVLNLIGDSYQKIDYLYDAGDTYRRALDMDPGNLQTLWRLRQNFDRLSDEARMREVDMAMEKIVAPKNLDLRARRVAKGSVFAQQLVFPGGRVALTLEWAAERQRLSPLISVFWNGRIILEDYLRTSALALDVETRVGENTLEVLPVSGTISLLRITWRPSGGR